MNRLLSKAITYINVKLLSKLDNRYWQLADERSADNITVIENTAYPEALADYYPHVTKETATPAIYHFFSQIFSRYLYKITDAVIDPKYSWAITSSNSIFKYSWPLIEDPWDAEKARPSRLGFLLRRSVPVEKGILLKFSWTNYYHFFFDALPQLYLCDAMGIPADVPLIVPAGYNNKQFIKDYLALLPLKRRVIVQEPGVYLKVKELFIIKDRLMSDQVNTIIQDIKAAHNNYIGKPYKTSERLFISRDKKHGRAARNIAELEQVARDRGFEVIEPGNYSWEEQQYLFSNARYVAGIHGAGLANIVFSRHADLRLLEVFPGNGVAPEHYQNIAKHMNYYYTSIFGEGMDSNNQFYISKDALAAALDQLTL